MKEEKIRALIVDDEENARFALREMLQQFCPQVHVLAEADGVATATDLAREIEFDVVFLDIQMMDGSGFDFLKQMDQINFEVIFTTAYDQFAIKAIKYSALDYLLKPLDTDELIASVDKVQGRKGQRKEQIDVLINNLKEEEKQKLVLSTSEGMHIVDIKNIIRCEADDYYTRFFLVDKRMIMVSKTLKDSGELLTAHDFVRSHRSHLVNMDYVKKYVKSDGGYLELKDGSQIPVSRRKKELILSLIQGI